MKVYPSLEERTLCHVQYAIPVSSDRIMMTHVVQCPASQLCCRERGHFPSSSQHYIISDRNRLRTELRLTLKHLTSSLIITFTRHLYCTLFYHVSSKGNEIKCPKQTCLSTVEIIIPFPPCIRSHLSDILFCSGDVLGCSHSRSLNIMFTEKPYSTPLRSGEGAGETSRTHDDF